MLYEGEAPTGWEHLETTEVSSEQSTTKPPSIEVNINGKQTPLSSRSDSDNRIHTPMSPDSTESCQKHQSAGTLQTESPLKIPASVLWPRQRTKPGERNQPKDQASSRTNRSTRKINRPKRYQ